MNTKTKSESMRGSLKKGPTSEARELRKMLDELTSERNEIIGLIMEMGYDISFTQLIKCEDGYILKIQSIRNERMVSERTFKSNIAPLFTNEFMRKFSFIKEVSYYNEPEKESY